MPLIRALLTIVLTVGLLPWGAYAAALAVSEIDDRNTGRIERMADAPRSVAPVIPSTKVSTPKRCRIATLPGGCGADHGLLPSADASTPPARHGGWRLTAVRMPSDPSDPPPTTPPRPV